MAVAFVQEADSGAMIDGLLTSRSVTLGATPTNNNLIVVCGLFGNDPTGAAISNAGFTQVKDTGTVSATLRLIMWYKIASSDSATITLTTTNNAHIVLWVAEYSGINTSTPLDTSQMNSPVSNEGGSGVTDHPANLDSLRIAYLATNDQGANKVFHAINQVWVDDLVQRGNDFSHVNSNLNESNKVKGRVYEGLTASGSERPACATWAQSSSNGVMAGIAAVFKPASGTASSAVTSNSGGASGTLSQSKSAHATSTQPSFTFTSTPTSGHLLVAIIDVIAAGVNVTASPTGWAQYGSTLEDSFNGAQLHRTSVWWKVSDGTESGAQTWTIASSQIWEIYAFDFGGNSATDPTIGALAPSLHSHLSSTSSSGDTTQFGSDAGAIGTTNTVEIVCFRGNGTTTLNSFTNSFTALASEGANFFIKPGYKFTDGTGVLFCRATTVIPSIGTTQGINGTLSCSFVVVPASGGDHWAWGEPAADSWSIN